MHRLLALLLLLPGAVVAAVLAAPPAEAGAPTHTDVHGFSPEFWGLRSYDCAGTPDDGTTYRLEATPIRTDGSGSLRVETGPDSVGGALYSDTRFLRSLSYPVYGVTGSNPHARWHIEIGDHVLESDPIPITLGDWTTLDLLDVTLHEGDWSGTIDDWTAANGTPDQWTGGILTGGCLGSPQVQIDEPRTKWFIEDLEPSDWSTFTLTLPYGKFPSSFPVYGDSFELVARVRHTDLETGETTPVPDARVELSRRFGQGRWQPLDTLRTDDSGNASYTTRALRSADYRARVSKAGRPTKVAVVDIPAYLDLARPRINGKPCRETTYDDSCGKQHILSNTFTLSGRLAPGGQVVAQIARVDATTNAHRKQRVTVDERGHWSASFHVRDGVRYHWEILGLPTSKRYEPSKGYASFIDVG